MLCIVAWLSALALAMPRRSPLTRTMRALFIATSVPVPIAMPTLAWASAGASLTPSPAIATIRPWSCSALTCLYLSSGITPALTSSRPRRRPTAAAVTGLSPVSITMRMPDAFSSRIASGVESLMASATPT